MQDSFAPAQVMEGRGDVLGVQYGDDSNFVVEFYTREVEDQEATRRKGRVILKAVPYCKKYAIGDTRTVWDAPIAEEDKMRFPRQYAAYERGEKETVIGTPLDAWPLLNSDMRLALKNAGFKTVEQVASVTDSVISTMGQTGALVQRVQQHAKHFIKSQEEGEAERRLAEQLEERDNEISAMKAQMQAMAQQMERMNEHKLASAIPQSESAIPAQPLQPKPEPETPGLEALEALPELEPLEVVDPAEPPQFTVKRGYQCYKVMTDNDLTTITKFPTKAEAEAEAERLNNQAA